MMCIRSFLLFLLTCSLLSADDFAQGHAHGYAQSRAQEIKSRIACPPSIRQAQKAGEYKKAIDDLKKHIEEKPTSELYLELAVTLLADQQEEEALKVYTRCLEKAKSSQVRKMTAREKEQYDTLLALYIAGSDELESKVASVIKSHPDYNQCQFFLAASCANKRAYEPFFYIFYESYSSYPDSFLSLKTQGVIASLVYQRANTLEEKELWRLKAMNGFAKALMLTPQDTALHKMLIYTSSDKDRKQAVQFVVDTIIKNNVQIARGEIPFYINHALWQDEHVLAERLLEKAHSWYAKSRILDQMQESISQHKAKK